ncbi:unnamed protein product [Acanthosepion pharaonis]|uniref:Uncharacterized protein n=1 Tax=Acanthosepion pharaonis TaxID=158019 RepID=A0A812EM39_ACAPH|nr:unnamed protein product [Sepia pharaonis]
MFHICSIISTTSASINTSTAFLFFSFPLLPLFVLHLLPHFLPHSSSSFYSPPTPYSLPSSLPTTSVSVSSSYYFSSAFSFLSSTSVTFFLLLFRPILIFLLLFHILLLLLFCPLFLYIIFFLFHYLAPPWFSSPSLSSNPLPFPLVSPRSSIPILLFHHNLTPALFCFTHFFVITSNTSNTCVYLLFRQNIIITLSRNL